MQPEITNLESDRLDDQPNETGAKEQVAPKAGKNADPALEAETSLAKIHKKKKKDENGDEPEQREGSRENQKKRQSVEENARYAAARRKAEQEKMTAIAETERQFYETHNLINPYTGKQVKSRADFAEYQRQYDEELASEMAARPNISAWQYEAMTASTPEVEQARALQQQVERMEMGRQVEAEIAEIARYEPGIKEPADITKLPEIDAMRMYLQQGMTLLDAYRAASFNRKMDSAEQEKERSVRQIKASINKHNAKGHLQRLSGNQGEGSPSVPPEVWKEYRKLMPELNNQEIFAHYHKYAKR